MRLGSALVGTLTLLSLLCGAPIARGALIAPHATVAGKTVGEWAAEWWKNVSAQPQATNPLFDATGANGGQGDQGAVFFLYGVLGNGTVSRTVTVNNTQNIFIPILNQLYFQGPGDPPLSVADARTLIKGIVDGYAPFLTVDGVPVSTADVLARREVSPEFTFPLIANNIYGYPAGSTDYAVDDGYYAVLTPLSIGQHTFRFGGSLGPAYDNARLDINYTVNVVAGPGNNVPLPAAVLAGGVAGPLAVALRKRRARR